MREEKEAGVFTKAEKSPVSAGVGLWGGAEHPQEMAVE